MHALHRLPAGLRALALLAAAAALTACAVPESQVAGRRTPPDVELPPMKTFNAYRPETVRESNRQIAADFVELSFQMESGRQLQRLTRYERSIRIGVKGTAPTTLSVDLARLLDRMRREARIDIALAGAGEEPNLIVEALPRRSLQRYVPEAACFVVPNVAGWDDFVKNRRSRNLDWAALEERTLTSVFIPNDVSPQEVRDCLHEEIAQAIGPLNDLYRLENSVFNDDNFHAVLTAFDMLILRITYAPELRSGMSRNQTAAALPSILARLNPRGISGPPAQDPKPNRDWIEAMERALGPGVGPRRRQEAAIEALRIAQSEGFRDNRLPFSFYALGRLSLGADAELSLASFLQAGGLYQAMPGAEVQAAHVSMQVAAFALTTGQGETALRIINDALPAVKQSENAALLATLMMMKAEALDLVERPNEASAVRLDSLGWARYGIGNEDWVIARLTEVAALPPPRQER